MRPSQAPPPLQILHYPEHRQRGDDVLERVATDEAAGQYSGTRISDNGSSSPLIKGNERRWTKRRSVVEAIAPHFLWRGVRDQYASKRQRFFLVQRFRFMAE
jgi:hypothetical protein